MASRNIFMPEVEVYFVNPFLRPSQASSLMNSGVSKSGSPTERSMTSNPRSRRSIAACAACRVEDSCIRATFSATGNRSEAEILSFIHSPEEILRGYRTGRETRNENSLGWECRPVFQHYC